MNDQEIRLKCLEIVNENPDTKGLIQDASALADFIFSGSRPQITVKKFENDCIKYSHETTEPVDEDKKEDQKTVIPDIIMRYNTHELYDQLRNNDTLGKLTTLYNKLDDMYGGVYCLDNIIKQFTKDKE